MTIKHSGFSLLELSIVLVIIGLIAGGIVTGSSMIRAAELRAITTEFNQYQTAVHTFRDKYLGLPGDLKNATAFWGAEPAANCPGDDTTPSTSTATCDGDGDGNLDSIISGEPFRFWQHLANAELIAGSFTGVTGPGGSENAIFGENTPTSKFSGAGWGVGHTPSFSGNAFFFDGAYHNYMTVGSPHPTGQTSALLQPEEMWNIDVKQDDGKPGQGKIVTVNYSDCSDAADSTDISADYALTSEFLSCHPAFLNVF